MTAIQWHEVGSKFYEAGLDRGVLYVEGQTGVPWNGLISVTERTEISKTPVYLDGVKFNDIVGVGDFSGTIKAFTYPDAFEECQGVFEDKTGFFLTGQAPKRFNLVYRTKVGEGSTDIDEGYKIHILYNLTATPNAVNRKTLSLDVDPLEFDWAVTAIPEQVEGFRPTAHVIIDSRKTDPWLLQDLEAILYGDDTRDPTLPPLMTLMSFLRKWDRIIIVDNNDGTWSAISARDDLITMLNANTFQITEANATFLDADTYTISSSEKVEEDI